MAASSFPLFSAALVTSTVSPIPDSVLAGTTSSVIKGISSSAGVPPLLASHLYRVLCVTTPLFSCLFPLLYIHTVHSGPFLRYRSHIDLALTSGLSRTPLGLSRTPFASHGPVDFTPATHRPFLDHSALHRPLLYQVLPGSLLALTTLYPSPFGHIK